MNNPTQTLEELQSRCDDLQGQVIRFLKVEQDLIHTRNQLDRDLARFKAIQSYSQRIMQAESMEEFAEITVEAVIETFEIECSAFFSYDKAENCLKVKSMFGFEEDYTDCRLDDEWITLKGISLEGNVIVENVSPDSDPMGSMGLSQVIISPYHDDSGQLVGMLMGGITVSKKGYYEEISEELVPSFMVFTQQMSSQLQNFEAKRYLNEKVQRRTAEVVEQKKEIEEKNVVLEDQKEELHSMLESLKLTQSQLVQSEKMASLGQLVAGIAHEINNPVTFISAGVDSLGANLDEVRQVLEVYHRLTPINVEEKLKEIEDLKSQIDYKQAIREINSLIESIKNGTERTTQIVNGLRTFSRLDEDVLKVADIHEGLDSTLILLRNRYKNRIEIIKEYGSIPQLECFPGQLNQVFMNILSNAIDAIADKGEITISTSASSGFIRIHIKDSGIGIPDNIRAKIFDPFYTTKEVGEGTGLGLSISHGIIEKHKGSIKVQSQEGKGTEFIINLPLTQKN
jgi:signal transduction histidine kinase